jgi:hypothetical protein
MKRTRRRPRRRTALGTRTRAALALGTALAPALAACARGGAPAARRPAVHDAVRGAARDAAPPLALLRANQLDAARRRVRAGDPALRPAYNALMRDAAAALRAGPWAVTDKRTPPPGGDRRDYLSFGPYWWPDPAKPNGLPYVRRDGIVNPASRADSDAPRLYALADAVETLALAHYFVGDVGGNAAYARRAGSLLRRFFLDSATAMRPHLRFGQAIPGVSGGRGIGILDTRELGRVADAVALLRGSPGWTAADDRGLRAWARAYLAWLRTSPQGADEADEANNHGTWYDAQLAGVALFAGDTALARDVVTRTAPARMAAQIRPDGTQPEELARTRPLHYSVFNLEAMARLAETAHALGVDLWGWRAPNGASLRGALAFVAPYADPGHPWRGPQATVTPPEALILPLRRAASALGDPSLAAPLAKLPAERTAAHRSRLLYPDVP